DEGGGIRSLRSAMELLVVESHGSVFFAERGDRLVTITPDDARADLHTLVLRHGARAGFSAVATWDRFDEALTESQRALARATAAQPISAFDDIVRGGLLGHLEHTQAQTI